VNSMNRPQQLRCANHVNRALNRITTDTDWLLYHAQGLFIDISRKYHVSAPARTLQQQRGLRRCSS